MLATIHQWVGISIVAAFVVLMLWGAGLRIFRRPEAPVLFWGIQHYTENVLLLQTVLGLVLLVMGRRIVGEPFAWLHYFYGSLFPLIAVVGGRIAAMRREERDYVGLTWGALVAFGLTARALMSGLGYV